MVVSVCCVCIWEKCIENLQCQWELLAEECSCVRQLFPLDQLARQRENSKLKSASMLGHINSMDILEKKTKWTEQKWACPNQSTRFGLNRFGSLIWICKFNIIEFQADDAIMTHGAFDSPAQMQMLKCSNVKSLFLSYQFKGNSIAFKWQFLQFIRTHKIISTLLNVVVVVAVCLTS